MKTNGFLQHLQTSDLSDKKVYIHTHDFPDPDAIASAFGLQRLLLHFDIPSTICYDGTIDRSSTSKMLAQFNIEMKTRSEIDSSEENIQHILVDSQISNSNLSLEEVPGLWCIDHHPIFANCDYTFFDIRRVGACASIITSYYKQAGIVPEQKVASALCYGIKMDTNDFNRGSTQFDVDMYAYLFSLSDYELVSSMYSNTLVVSDLNAFAAAIENIYIEGNVGFAFIPFECHPTLVAIISDFLLSTEEVTVSIVYSPMNNTIKFSVRSEANYVHAGELTHAALEHIGNGGGHPTMAGGIIYEEYVKQFQDNLPKEIHKRFLTVLAGMQQHIT